MDRGSTTLAKAVAATALSAAVCVGAAIAPVGLAQAADGATYTIVNDTGRNVWFKGCLLEDPAPGSVGSGWLAPGSYTIKTKNENQLNAEFIIVDEKRALVMMQQSNGVAQIQCATNIGHCTPRGPDWSNSARAIFTP